MNLEFISSVPDHLPEMARVMSIALQRDIPLPRLRRKYLVGGDAGQGYGYLIFDNGQAIGTAGSIPFRYLAPDGSPIVGAQYCDFGLLPAYRGTGLFHELCEKLHEDTRQRGAAFSFAFTSEGSRAAMERALDHTTIGDLCSFDICLSTHTRFFTRAKDRALRTVGWRSANGSSAPASRALAGQSHAERGADFVRTRIENGIRFLQINGHAVMVRPGSITSVALPETLDPTEVEPLLRDLSRMARRAGTRTLRLMLSPEDPIFAVVEQIAGPSPGRLKPCVYIWDARVSLDGLSFGYADYENF